MDDRELKLYQEVAVRTGLKLLTKSIATKNVTMRDLFGPGAWILVLTTSDFSTFFNMTEADLVYVPVNALHQYIPSTSAIIDGVRRSKPEELYHIVCHMIARKTYDSDLEIRKLFGVAYRNTVQVSL